MRNLSLAAFLVAAVVLAAFPAANEVAAQADACDRYEETGFNVPPVNFGTIIVHSGQEMAVDGIHISFTTMVNGETVMVEIQPHTDSALLGVFGPGTYRDFTVNIGSLCIGDSDSSFATRPVLEYRQSTTGIPSDMNQSEFWVYPQGAGESDLAYFHSGIFASMSLEGLEVETDEYAIVDAVEIEIQRGTRSWSASLNHAGEAPITQLPELDDLDLMFNVGAISIASDSNNLRERQFCGGDDNDGAAACDPGYYLWNPRIR